MFSCPVQERREQRESLPPRDLCSTDPQSSSDMLVKGVVGYPEAPSAPGSKHKSLDPLVASREEVRGLHTGLGVPLACGALAYPGVLIHVNALPIHK